MPPTEFESHRCFAVTTSDRRPYGSACLGSIPHHGILTHSRKHTHKRKHTQKHGHARQKEHKAILCNGVITRKRTHRHTKRLNETAATGGVETRTKAISTEKPCWKGERETERKRLPGLRDRKHRDGQHTNDRSDPSSRNQARERTFICRARVGSKPDGHGSWS